MKRIFLMCALLCASSVSACNTWENHWIKGLEFQKNQDYEQALQCYNLSVDLIESNQKHDFVLIDRAKIYMHEEQWDNAIDDLTEVLESKDLLLADRIEATKCRMVCYSNLDLMDELKQDYCVFSEIYPYMPKFEYTKKHQIIRHANHMSADEKQFLIEMWIAIGLCKDESKAKYYDNGTFVIELEQGTNKICECERKKEPNMSIPEFVIHNGHGGRELRPEEAKHLLEKQIAGCNYWCDKVFVSALAIANKAIKTWTNFAGAIVAVEVLKDGCKSCCAGNGGFYVDCIQPIVDWEEDLAKKLDEFMEGRRIILYPRF